MEGAKDIKADLVNYQGANLLLVKEHSDDPGQLRDLHASFERISELPVWPDVNTVTQRLFKYCKNSSH